MTRNYYTTGNYKPDHSTCGSKKNTESRDRNKNYKKGV